MSTITGDAEFNNSNNNGTVAGESSFNGDSVNTGTVSGIAYFSDTSTNSGTVEGNAVFYDTAINTGEVTEAAVFLDEAQNNGEIGVECTAAPVITQHPENVYNGPLDSFVGTSYSVRAEENPWVDVSWNVLMYFGGNAVMPYSIAGPYAEWKDLVIPYLGGLPGDAIKRATINCRLSNGVGEVHATEAEYISGGPPALVLPSSFENIEVDTVNVTEGQPLVFVFRATSAASSVTVGGTRSGQIADPTDFEAQFNTAFDTGSLVGRRKIDLAYLTVRNATRQDNGIWKLKITDPIGATLSPYDITVNVTNVDAPPEE